MADKRGRIRKDLAAACVIVVMMTIDDILYGESESLIELRLEPRGHLRIHRIHDDNPIGRDYEHTEIPNLPESVEVASQMSNLVSWQIFA
jgi:hypothetical protein